MSAERPKTLRDTEKPDDYRVDVRYVDPEWGSSDFLGVLRNVAILCQKAGGWRPITATQYTQKFGGSADAAVRSLRLLAKMDCLWEIADEFHIMDDLLIRLAPFKKTERAS